MLREFISTSFKNGRISCAFLILTLAFAIGWGIYISARHKRDRKITPIRIMFVGTFISAVMYFLPLMQEILGEQGGRGFWTDAVLTSMQFAFRLFILDGELLWIFDEEVSILNDPAVKDFYTILGSILYAIAPVLTFGFVLTFFNNLFAWLAYFFGSLCPTHVFSELNEKSVALASDLRKNSLFNVIVFTDISEKVLEEKMELVEDARMLGAILFSKDFDSIKYRGKISFRKLKFYLISDDEEKKLRHAEVVVKNFDYKNVELRIFSSNIRSELLVASFDTKKMRAIRVDDIQTLVYHNLYTNGKMLFEKARTIPGENDKVISAVIVGLGQYGKEMLKALTWFCQLEGYKLQITAFDSDKNAEQKFKFKCPELMDPNYNGNYENNGEPRYKITIHGGIDASTPEFKDHLEKINDATYIFVCLGDDETNLKTAVDVRTICESIQYLGDAKHKPNIETVIYDSRLASSIRTSWDASVKGVTNFAGDAYNILVTGDLESFYSLSTLVNKELIEEGLFIHTGYCVYPPVEKKSQNLKRIHKCCECNKSDCKYRNKGKNKENCLTCKNNVDREIEESFESDNTGACINCNKKIKKIENIVEKIIFSRYIKNKVDAYIYSFLDDLCLDCKIKLGKELLQQKIKAESDFWKYEYNFNSSIAKAIHRKLRIDLGVYESGKGIWHNLCCCEKVKIANPEHIRWSAYMRSKGFQKTEKYVKSQRNYLGKRHHCLVPTDELGDKDLEKD